MNPCNFLDSKGDKSLLYSALEQKYGADRALQLWNWAHSEAFTGKKEVNGEPTMEELERVLPQNTEETNKVVVDKTRFDVKSLDAFNRALKEVYIEARQNPSKTYELPFTSTDVLKFGKNRVDNSRLAHLLDRDDAPHNVIYEQSMFSRMQNLPKRFLGNITLEESNPLQLSSESVDRQMQKVFVQVRDTNGKPTGEYFSLDKQNQAIDSVIYRFYNLYSQLSSDPQVKEKLGRKSMVGYVRERIFGEFNNAKDQYSNIASGTSVKDGVSVEQATQKHADFTAVLNSFYHSGSRNNIWNFAMEKLANYGIKVKDDGQFEDNAPEAVQLPSDNSLVDEEEGLGLKDFSDSSFQMDMKDTASTRMKLFIMSTVQSHFEDEKEPKTVDLFIKNDKTRQALVNNTKKDLILAPSAAENLKLTPLSDIKPNVSQLEKDRLSQKIAVVNGVKLRLTAVGKLNERTLADQNFSSRILDEEGRKPEVGDVYVTAEKYVQKKDMLTADKNFLGMPQLTDYEGLFQDLTGLLANREPNYKEYLAAMKASVNPNIQQVATKLEKSAEHIQKEFTSVMSSSYHRMLMVLYKKGFDGFQEGRLIDSNRNSEVQTIQKGWQEAQKTSEILKKDDSGHVVVDHNLAMGLWDELQDIYKTSPIGRHSPQELEELSRKHNQDQIKKLKNERIAESDRQFNELNTRKRDLFHTVLEVNGINMDSKAEQDIYDHIAKIGKGSGILSIFGGGLTESGKPTGLIDILIHRLALATEVGSEDGDDDIHEAYKANNPLYTENTAIGLLAKTQLNYISSVHSQTHKSAEGKTIFSYGLNTALSHAVRKFSESLAYRDRYNNSPFASKAWLLDKLQNKAAFQVEYMDGLKNEFGTRDGITRPDMSDREQWMYVLSSFQNKGRKYGNMVSLTHSDKTTTPIFRNVPKEDRVMVLKDGKLIFNDSIIEKVYTHVFMAEYNRMTQPGGENIKGYAEGKKLFYFLPKFNKNEMQKLISDNVITQGELDAIHKYGVTNPLFKPTAIKLINLQLTEMVNETKNSWDKSGLQEAGLVGDKRYYNTLLSGAGFSPRSDGNIFYPGEQEMKDEHKNPIRTHLAAADFTVNSFLFNTSLSQLFYGDPALTFKKDLATTLVEYGKRLAKDVAPGRDGEFSHNPTYTTITAADFTPVAKELDGVKGYEKGVEATDAQELTTVKEHLNVLYAYGKITKAQWEESQKIIKDAKGGYYEFSPDMANIVMQPMKPVAAGLRDAVDGVMNYDYVKSSSFPLYPPMTQGLELDKIRKAMEKGGVDRINFSSAKKIGSPVRQVQLFNSNGSVNEDVFNGEDWKTSSRQSLDRSEFRLQQEVPYDEDKDSILTVSQMNKLIIEKVPTITTPFSYQGREVSGKELRAIKEDIRKELINNSHGEFLDKVGAVYNKEQDSLTFKDKKKFYDLLANEAASRDGYTMNDVLALTSFTNGELTVPLTFTPSASRFEGLMMSMIQKIVKIKMPGKSFIQASPAGFQSIATWENSNLDQSKIVWTKPLTGALKTAHLEDGKVVPAQVLVGFNYFNKSGSRLNIQDYIKDENGKKMLDTEKLPAELFQLIGARIPNQGHSSMLPIEIAGFLPQEMGDIVVVPAAITKQMGADFDVDKLYTYHRGYTHEGANLYPAEDDLKNQYFDVHWSVLTHPDMFNSMMSPLDKADAKTEATLLSSAVKNSAYYFSPTYQTSDFQSMKGAKVLVGQTSLALTSNAVIQDKNIRLEQIELDDNDKPKNVSAPIKIARKDGSALELTHLSGFGLSEYNGEVRTKADNIQIQQNESVDHAKNRIIDKINLDPNTSAASLAMSRLQSADKDVRGEALSFDYNARLLMQPIIREFSAEMSKANDSMSTTFDSNVRDKVFANLLDKYLKLAGELPETRDSLSHTNPAGMLETIQMKPNQEFYLRQLDYLDLFKQFDDVGQKLITIQSVTTQDTRGAGKDMLSVLNTVEKKSKLGISVDGRIISGTEGLYNGTEVGTTYDATIDTAEDLYSNELPYEYLKNTYKFITEQSGKDHISDETKRTVFNGMKSFAFTSKQLGLFGDVQKERARLLFSTAAGKSLAERVRKAQTTWGKNNYFLQRLQSIVDPDGVNPDRIEYNAAKAALSVDSENHKAWLDMLVSADEEKSQLGSDLIRYSYITGGLQSARNFVKFIPWASIEGSEIAPGLRDIHSKLDQLDSSPALKEQIIQHNPILARQLSPGLAETGSTFEKAPDTFILPALNPDTKGSNSAAKLIVTATADNGKKIEQYPMYLSYREGRKFLLYKKAFLEGDFNPKGITYTQIDTLGSVEGLEEYSASGEGTARSMIPENRAAWYDNIQPQPLMISNALFDFMKSPANKSNVLAQVGLLSDTGSFSSIINSLNTIAVDKQQPSHIRVLASALSDLDRNPAERTVYEGVLGARAGLTYKVGPIEGTPAQGKFASGLNILILDSRYIKDKADMAETIVHELLHYHTAMISMAMESEAQWDARHMNEETKNKFRVVQKFISYNPELQDKLNAVEDLRKDAFSKLRAMVMSKEGKDHWDKVTTKDAGKYGQLHYALNTSAEFISHVLSNPETMKFLDSMQYDGKKSMLDRFKELFSQFWGALMEKLGVSRGTYLEEAVKRTMDLLTYKQVTSDEAIKTNVKDFSSFLSDISNAKIATSPELDSIDKMIGKLQEQQQNLIGSYTGVIAPELRHDKRRKIEAIEDALKELRESRDLELIPKIGQQHLKWITQVNNKENPGANEIMTAIRIGNMWEGITKLLYGDETLDKDFELVKVADAAGKIVQSLISKSKDYIQDNSQGTIRDEDWKEDNLVDPGTGAAWTRSLSAAANSRVIQHIAGYVETIGRHENEDVRRLMTGLTGLEKEMKQYAGGHKGLESLYSKMRRADGWGLTLQYSQKWFDWRKTSIARRNAQISAIEKEEGDDITKSQKKRAVWSKFWADVNSKAAFVDTTVFFDPLTGKFNDNIEKAKADLTTKVGADHVDTLLARAQERYLRYVEDRQTFFELLDDEQKAGDKTAEEVNQEKQEFANRHSPNVFFDQVNNKKTFSAASDKYVAMAPKADNKEFWNEDYQTIMQDPKLADFYNRYSNIIDKLLSYLPKTLQESAGPGFLPSVRKAVMSEGLDIPQYIKTFNEKFTKTMTAGAWEEQMNERAFNKIPIQYVHDDSLPEEKSGDLIGIARVFGMMALHYKHFSVAKDVIEMGETILQEINKSRMEGISQTQQNGHVVTVQKGLENSIKALKYLKDYMVYRKPKELEFSLGGKMYAENTAEGKKFHINPIKNIQISKNVRELLAKRDDLEKRYINQTDEVPMTADEYQVQKEEIDREIAKYEGHTLYGSKLGDKLIGINQLKALSYNPFSAVANVAFGLISVGIHSSGKNDFTRAESWSAFKLMLNNTAAKFGAKNEMAEKIINTMDRLGVIGDYVDTRYGKAPEVRDNKPAWKRYADPFALMKSTDVFMKGVTTIAILKHQKVEVDTAEGKKTISIWDALDKNGQWNEALYGKRPEWSSEDLGEQKKWDKLVNRVVRVNMVLHGNQDKNSPKMINKNIIGRLLGQFRMSWLPEGWYNRTQDEHYDEFLERQVKGRYRTIGQLGVGGTLLVLGRQFMNLIPGMKMDVSSGVLLNDGRKLSESEVDLENMRRNFAELGFYLVISAGVLMLRHAAAGDDDDKDKSLTLLMNMLIRSKQDIDFYASPGVFDAVTRNIIPATSVITDYWKAVKATGRVLIDDDYEYDKWLLKLTKAGLPIPQSTLINKTKYMIGKDLETIQQ